MKKVSVEDVINDGGLTNNFIKVSTPDGKVLNTTDEMDENAGEDAVQWIKSYRLITTKDDGYLWPCMTFTKPNKVRSDGSATEVIFTKGD